MRALIQGSESERAEVLAEQGVNYAHCIDGLIRTCGLPKNDCSVVLVVASMGNAFLLPILASITSLPVEMRERLRTHIRTIIMWGSLHTLQLTPVSHSSLQNLPRMLWASRWQKATSRLMTKIYPLRSGFPHLLNGFQDTILTVTFQPTTSTNSITIIPTRRRKLPSRT